MIDIPGFNPTRREVFRDDGSVIVYVQAPVLMATPEVAVHLTRDQFTRYTQWRNRKGLIQELLPDLTVEQREMLMSGLDDANFKRIAREEEPE